MKKSIHELSAYEGEEVFRALANPMRLSILRLLNDRELNINEIGSALGANMPTVSKHVQSLEQAGLIETEYRAGVQGTQKRCRLRHERLIVSFDDHSRHQDQFEELTMPVGLYTLASPSVPCGLVAQHGYIGLCDEVQSFLLPERHQAQMLWMASGFVEYVFPNMVPTSVDIYKAELQLEICSEAPGYNDDYPSDITVWFNGVEIGTWMSPADFGGKRGLLNPGWWGDRNTQFGALKQFAVTPEGAFIDGMLQSSTTIEATQIQPQQPITVRIGVKPDARHQGGFNLFGRGFGNYQQDLILRLHYTPK